MRAVSAYVRNRPYLDPTVKDHLWGFVRMDQLEPKEVQEAMLMGVPMDMMEGIEIPSSIPSLLALQSSPDTYSGPVRPAKIRWNPEVMVREIPARKKRPTSAISPDPQMNGEV
ncbi:hypothetical protein HDU93_003923 [Gonapodya sp. JEL0774]|nr:hypothetical protein HDU93_003923 [Gonapodya sp. JEL0774]